MKTKKQIREELERVKKTECSNLLIYEEYAVIKQIDTLKWVLDGEPRVSRFWYYLDKWFLQFLKK